MGQSQDAAVSGGPPNYGARDNANMGTGADGQHPSTNMFLWQPLPGAFYAPCVDGDYDVTVFAHEFGHAVENRLEGKGVGARQGFPAGAMGEAFGDMNALEFVNESHIAPVPGADRYTEGAYVTGNPYNGIRDFLAGRPMGGQFPAPGQNPDTDPLNYSDIGFDNVGPEVHADGEFWIAAQIDLRDLFLQRYPSSGEAEDIACLRGQKSSNTCPGDRRWMQLYFDAMVMMSRNPTMQDARDAQLAADQARFGGANQDLLWQGFAMRGLGRFAQTNPNVGTGGNAANADTDPTPDFSSPLANNATLNFFADNKGNTLVPVKAKIYVGDYQARATQIADTDPSTNPDGTPRTVNLDNTAQFVPNLSNPRWSSYNLTAVAPGFGAVRFNVRDLPAGRDQEHPDPLRAELRLVVAVRDDHRRRARHEHEPRERPGRQRGHERRPDRRERPRPLVRDQARRRQPERLERSSGWASPRCWCRGTTASRHSARSTPTPAARGRTPRTRPATDRSTRAGRRSSRPRPTRSRR